MNSPGLDTPVWPNRAYRVLPGLRLTDLQQVSVRVAKEAADFPVGLLRRGEKYRPATLQSFVRGTAVRDLERELVAHYIGRRRRRERDRRLVRRGAASRDQQYPRAGDLKDGRRSPVLANLTRAENIPIEVMRSLEIAHDTQHGHLDAVGWKSQEYLFSDAEPTMLGME